MEQREKEKLEKKKGKRGMKKGGGRKPKIAKIEQPVESDTISCVS